jgi:DNA-directed RNA polymerase subunit RPC12/RpoP
VDDLLHRIKGALLLAGGDNSQLLADIDKRIHDQDEQLATIRCLKCGHKTSISITVGKPKPSPPPKPWYSIGYDGKALLSPSDKPLLGYDDD